MTVVYGSTGFRVRLLTAIGQYLGTAQVGRWMTSGTYLSTDTAITLDVLPATPDKAIAMTLYPVSDSTGTDTVIGLQLRIRGKPNDRISDKDIVDRAFDALHGVNGITLDGIPIVLIEHQSGAALGPDGNNRLEHTANYYITLTRTGPNRDD